MNSCDRYDSLFQWYGKLQDMDWRLLKAQVKQESQFDPMARGNIGDAGLAQFLAATFTEWAFRLEIKSPNPYNPEHSIQCQAAYMRWLCDQFPKNLDYALGAYNFGIGNVRSGKPWPLSTVQYVTRIKQYAREYGYDVEVA